MADAYSATVGGSLKIKGGLKKKKKKKNKAEEVVETLASVEEAKQQQEQKKADPRTPAQKAYDKVQRKRQAERILEKAQKTHKQRVEEFNGYLDTLTEHYDIPKVSWTK